MGEIDSLGFHGAVSAKRNGFIPVLTNKEIDEQKAKEEALEREKQKHFNNPVITGLAKLVLDAWERNRSFREQSGIDDDMLRYLRQRNSKYEPDKLAMIKEFGGTEVFFGTTDIKCDAAEGWIHDVLGSSYDPPWYLEPSPVPDLPEEVQEQIADQIMAKIHQNAMAGGQPLTLEQIAEMGMNARQELEDELGAEAQRRAEAMEKRVRDEQQEGRWENAFSDFVTNVVGQSAGFIKGPIVRMKECLVYEYRNGKTIVDTKRVLVREYESPSPFDMFPAPGSTSCDKGELIERVRYVVSDLLAMKGVKGYDDKVIDLVISNYGTSGFKMPITSDIARLELEKKNGNNGSDLKGIIEGIEYWGQITGAELIQNGIQRDLSGRPVNPVKVYDTNVIQIGQFTIFKGMNRDKLGRRPYSHCGWTIIPGSFWYKPVPEKLRHIQEMINGTVRALINYLGVGAGPQVIYNDISRIPAGEDITGIQPFKIHQFTNPGNSSLRPLEFFTPETKANELMIVLRGFIDMADDHTGIPSYEHGNDRARGAGRTASGLSMLMSNAARGIKRVIMRIDKYVVEPRVQAHVEHLMEFDPDESIKGDVHVMPKGTMSKIAKEELDGRRNEFLQQTANPIDAELLGPDNRRMVLEQQAKSLEIKLKPYSGGGQVPASSGGSQVPAEPAMATA